MIQGEKQSQCSKCKNLVGLSWVAGTNYRSHDQMLECRQNKDPSSTPRGNLNQHLRHFVLSSMISYACSEGSLLQRKKSGEYTVMMMRLYHKPVQWRVNPFQTDDLVLNEIYKNCSSLAFFISSASIN